MKMFMEIYNWQFIKKKKKMDPSTFEVLIEYHLGQGLLKRVQANR